MPSASSPAITIWDLSWSTPDGRRLFTGLNLTFGAERAGLIGRNGVGKTTLLRLMTGELRPQAGAVRTGGTLAVLRQSVMPAEGETVADLFGVRDALERLHRALQGGAAATELAHVDWTLEARMTAALASLGLHIDADTPLARLSGGQRTRAGLAGLLFAAPDFLLLDEPTNNLDREGRAALVAFLSAWRGGAIVVSHDRELLETMDAIVELTPLGVARYGGSWSAYRERKTLELAAARHDLADARKHAAEIARTAQRTAERKARKDGVGRRKRARGDIPKIALGRMKERSETTSGDTARLAERRSLQAAVAVATARERLEHVSPLSVALPPTRLPAGRIVVTVEHATAGYEPGRPVLRDLSFALVGPERVAITGPNGSGKTTLLALLAGGGPPLWSGAVRVESKFALLDQQLSPLDPSASIRDNFRRLNPEADENACRASLARFQFRADAALQQVSSLSGGEMLRAGLACVLGGTAPPHLLMLDEPTNHLDIDAIEAVEAGLRAYDGALLVVSHDEPFLAAVGITRRIALAVPANTERAGERSLTSRAGVAA